MKNKIQEGHSIDIVAGGAVVGGTVVAIGALLGVAVSSGGSGDLINIKTEGVYALPKTTGGGSGIAQGVAVYWTGTEVTATAAGNKFLGHVWYAALDADTTVAVGLLQTAGSDAVGAITPLTDNSGGTADNTIAVIATGTPADLAAQAAINTAIRNAIADLAAKVNAIIAAS